MRPELLITIPTPCDEDWALMMPETQGRYCSHCEKTVIDFSGWTDNELYGFFAANKKHVCGRFQATQVNRPIVIPAVQTTRLPRLAIALGLTLIFSQPGIVGAAPRSPLACVFPFGIDPSGQTARVGDNYVFKATIVDENGAPVNNASIKLMLNNAVVYAGVSDTIGEARIAIREAGKFDLSVEAAGHASLFLSGVVVPGVAMTITIHSIFSGAVLNPDITTTISGGAMPIITGTSPAQFQTVGLNHRHQKTKKKHTHKPNVK